PVCLLPPLQLLYQFLLALQLPFLKKTGTFLRIRGRYACCEAYNGGGNRPPETGSASSADLIHLHLLPAPGNGPRTSQTVSRNPPRPRVQYRLLIDLKHTWHEVRDPHGLAGTACNLQAHDNIARQTRSKS